MNHTDVKWAGPMGDEYTQRQALPLENRTAMFMRVGASIRSPLESAIEFGANTGDNLRALRTVFVSAQVTGVEPNAKAVRELAQIATVYHGTIEQFGKYQGHQQYDLAFTRGVLIHIQPCFLEETYDVIYNAARRWIMLAEYYNPKPVAVEYRGEMGLLWKRDFAGEMMDRHRDLELVDYGFIYKRDPHYPQDDVTWFLMRKRT